MINQSELPLDALRKAEAAILTALDGGMSLRAVLTDLIHVVEAGSDVETFASVLLVSDDGLHLIEGAAPSLPADYNAVVNGLAIGPSAGSCGTAAFYGEPVFVNDIKTDPLWSDYREVAAAAGLRACWSLPIKNADGRVIATFASYYREPRHPRPHDYEAIRLVTDTVRLAIEKDRARQIA